MIKVLQPSDFNGMLRGPSSCIVDVRSRGAIDRAWMEKTAAAGVFAHTEIKPDPNCSIIHLIALGDAETYGMNKNADLMYRSARRVGIPYPEPGEPPYYDVKFGNKDRAWTFTKYAKVFRDHCFPAGTNVLDGSFTNTPIETIKEGDFVIAGSGRRRRVITTFARKYSGQMLSFEVRGASKPIACTADHPWLVVPGDGPRRVLEEMPARHVRKGDYLLTPKACLSDREVGESLMEGGFACSPVTGVSSTHVTDLPVYNLEVEVDHTYIVEGFAAHNCNKKTDPYFGIVKDAAHNDAMDRVELLIQVDNDGWRDDLEKLAQDKPIDFSMALKTPQDRCTLCGHASKSRDEYCDHLAKMAGCITTDGHQIGAINDNYIFFDISRVPVRADRIAMGLMKAAAARMSSAEIASISDFVPPGGEPLMLTPKTISKLAALRKLADMEKQIGGATADSILGGAAPAVEPEDIPEPCMSRMKTCDPSSVLAALADVKVSVSLKDFLRLVLRDKFQEVEGCVPAASHKLPGIFGRLASDAHSAVSGLPFEDDNDMLPASVRDMISNLSMSHGFGDAPVRRKITIAIMRKPSSRGDMEKRSSAAADPVSEQLADKIAEAYGKYKLAFAVRGDNYKNDLLTKMIILQDCR